jgi:hypothetical protein
MVLRRRQACNPGAIIRCSQGCRSLIWAIWPAGPLLTVHYPGGAVVTAQGKSKERIFLRQTTDPEPWHREVYRALALPAKPLRTKRLQA